MTILPASLMWRTFAVMVAALVLSQAAAIGLLNRFVWRRLYAAASVRFRIDA